MDNEKTGAVIRKKVVECGIIIGYEVEAYNKGITKTTKMPIEKLIQLMQKGIHVENATLFNGQMCMKAGELARLPEVKDEFIIDESIKNDKDITIGYVISGTNGQHRIDIKTAWRLAASGSIKNLRACIEKGSNRKILIKTAEN